MAESEISTERSTDHSRRSSVSSDSGDSRNKSPDDRDSESEDSQEKQISSSRNNKSKIKEKQSNKKTCQKISKNQSKNSDSRSESRVNENGSRSRRTTQKGVAGSNRNDVSDRDSAAGGGSETSERLQCQKLEPKFEPRFTLYKHNNTVMDGMKKDTMYYYEHRRKIAEAKPLVDNTPPPIFSHVYCNMKKLKVQQDRQDAIEKDNQLLLAKLVNAMTTTRIDNWNTLCETQHQNPRKQKQKQEELMQIEAENRRLFHRIDRNRRRSSMCESEQSRHSNGTRTRASYKK